mgnify:CR=1 FL=1
MLVSCDGNERLLFLGIFKCEFPSWLCGVKALLFSSRAALGSGVGVLFKFPVGLLIEIDCV